MKIDQAKNTFIPIILKLETQEEVDLLLEALLRQAGRNEPMAGAMAEMLEPFSKY